MVSDSNQGYPEPLKNEDEEIQFKQRNPFGAMLERSQQSNEPSLDRRNVEVPE